MNECQMSKLLLYKLVVSALIPLCQAVRGQPSNFAYIQIFICNYSFLAPHPFTQLSYRILLKCKCQLYQFPRPL